MPPPNETGAIALHTGGVKDSVASESWFRQDGRPFVRNVTQATLQPFLPDPSKATGAAVIVAPGGGFLMLSMDNEGWAVARALADQGIAAFVLKYRLRPTPAETAGFEMAIAGDVRQRRQSFRKDHMKPEELVPERQGTDRRCPGGVCVGAVAGPRMEY